MEDKNSITASVIIPVYNEEKYIRQCIKSVLNQDYPEENVEYIFVDGNSKDKTVEIIRQYAKEYPYIKVFNNPNRTAPYAMNIGIKNSSGKYIVRLDAHSEYDKNYISKCISTLKKTNADNVGGIVITKGQSFIGRVYALVLSCKFGVGNSGFRTDTSSGYVDTVPFGTFKRETFIKYGLYDERLTRNQDYELNYRIRKNGGRIYLNTDIKLTYYCKNTITDILKQSYQNGKWNIVTSKFCPGSMSVRHFIPLIFLSSLIIIPVIILIIPAFAWLFIAEIVLYFVLDLIFSFKIYSKINYLPMLLIMFPMFHISYGTGSLMEFICEVIKR